MLAPGDSFRSPKGTVVELLAYGPERLALRRTLPPGTGRTAPHRHLEDAVERFTLLEGEATGKLGKDERRLRTGDVLEIPRGAVHVHPHTGPSQTATVEHVIEPCPAFPLVYFPSWLRWLAAGRVDGQDEPTFLGIMAVIDAAKGDSWVAGPPIPVQKALARVLAPIANRRGYRASVD
jgi:quercetin dioxygenase-like cupin family protein